LLPDARERLELLEQRRREAEEYERERIREAREMQREERSEKERRWNSRWTSVVGFLSFLIAPVIISITVFDLPARLGFGGSGAERLELYKTQLEGTGCKVMQPIKSVYTKAPLSELLPPEGRGCMHVLAAGGPGHSQLTLKLFDHNGREAAKSEASSDPRLVFCAPRDGMFRYEVGIGLLDKGRLSHMVLLCPEQPLPQALEPPPAAKPASGKRKK
jgi:hypothetical protein